MKPFSKRIRDKYGVFYRMPRDLFGQSQSPEPRLTASPETQTPQLGTLTGGSPGNEFTIVRDESEDREVQLSNSLRKKDEKRNLHPYVQLLSLSDLDACLALENAAFPEKERASREKYIYRLTTCPELTLGLFSSTSTRPTPGTQSIHDAARAPDSSTPSHTSLLLGTVIAVLSNSPSFHESSMQIPPSFSHPLLLPTSSTATHTSSLPDIGPQSEAPPHSPIETPSTSSKDPTPAVDTTPSLKLPDSSSLPPPPSKTPSPTHIPGHNSLGRTLCLHSLSIHPSYQRLGLGRTLLKSYLQRIESSGICDRIVLITRPRLVGWYVGMGFVEQFAGGGWREMSYEVVDKGPGS